MVARGSIVKRCWEKNESEKWKKVTLIVKHDVASEGEDLPEEVKLNLNYDYDPINGFFHPNPDATRMCRMPKLGMIE